MWQGGNSKSRTAPVRDLELRPLVALRPGFDCPLASWQNGYWQNGQNGRLKIILPTGKIGKMVIIEMELDETLKT